MGEILPGEFKQPMGLMRAALAAAMGVQRKHLNEPCNSRRSVTAATAPGVLAQRAAAQRSLGSDEQPEGARADRASQAGG